MRKPGSLEYLKQLSGAILAYDEKYEQPQERGEGVNTEDRKVAWAIIVVLSNEIREALGTFKKERKRADQHLEG